MKKNVKLMLKVAFISVLFVFVIAARSFAAGTDGVSFNYDFSNIPEAGSSSTSTSTDTSSSSTSTDTSSSSSSSASNSTSTSTSTSDSASKSKTNTKSTSSASKSNIPATGSNIEIIFAVGIAVIVSGAVLLYKKQNIKLK